MRRLSLTMLVAAIAVALASVSAGAEPVARTVDSIDYATSFGNFGRDAYVYVAIEKGYFQQAELEVNVTSGPGSVDNIEVRRRRPARLHARRHRRARRHARERGRAREDGQRRPPEHDVGDLLAPGERARDARRSSTARRSPTRPPRPCACSSRSTRRRRGSTRRSVTWRDAAPPALPALLASKQVDGIGQFVVGRPLVAKAAGQAGHGASSTPKVLPGLLGIGIVASDEKIRSNPGEVRAVRARDQPWPQVRARQPRSRPGGS